MTRSILTSMILIASLALAAGCDSPKKDADGTAQAAASTEVKKDDAKADDAKKDDAKADDEKKDDAKPADEGADKAEPAADSAELNPILLDPSKATETAPDSYKVKLTTTKGDIVIQVTKAWAPNGADRFYNLVKAGFFNEIAFFRVINGFMAQFGIHGNPKVAAAWRDARIQDDPVKESNTKGRVTFATAGPNTRTTQFFINFSDRNKMLDGQGFSPFGEVVEGMDVVEKINDEYGEGAPRGRGPDQGMAQAKGNEYLKAQFPNLDYIKSATIIE